MSDKPLMQPGGERYEPPPAVGDGADLRQMMRLAVEQGESGVAALERLVALQERAEARAAQTAYAADMAAFQAACPSVAPNRVGAHGARYADREQVMHVIQPHLSRHGFAVTFSGEQDETGYTAICKVSHVAGHSETSRFRVPREKAGNRMNVSQAEGSASEYAMRYALKSALNLRTGDRDDDGAAAGRAEPVSDEQAADIEALIEDVGADRAKFLRWAKAESVAEMDASRYAAAVEMLERKR